MQRKFQLQVRLLLLALLMVTLILMHTYADHAAVAKKAPVKKKTAAVGNFMPVKMSNIFAPLKKGTASSVPKPKPKPLAHPDQEYDHPPQWLLDGLAGPPKDGGFVMHPEVTGKCDSTPKMKCPVTSVSKAQTACNADPKCKFFTFTGPHGLRQGSSAYPMPNCAVMCETIPSDGSWLTQTWKAGDAMKYKGWATGVRKKNLHSFPAVVEVAETPSPTPVPQFKPGTKVANFMPVNPGAIGNILKDDHSMFKAPEVTLGGDLKPTKQPTSQLAAVAATSKTAPAAAAAAAASTSAATIAAATLRGGKGKKSSDTSGGDKSGSGCISYCKPMCLPGCIKSNQWYVANITDCNGVLTRFLSGVNPPPLAHILRRWLLRTSKLSRMQNISISWLKQR
jgi:hypothetical protein